MNIDAVLIKNDGFTVRAMGDETLILDPDGSAIHVADEVGGFIYRQVDGARSLSDIVGAIMDEYDIDRATAESDLLAYAAELVSQNILRTA